MSFKFKFKVEIGQSLDMIPLTRYFLETLFRSIQILRNCLGIRHDLHSIHLVLFIYTFEGQLYHTYMRTKHRNIDYVAMVS